MAEFEFESRLDKMFGQAQAFDDAAPFAARVQSKLNRRWATRRVFIGTLGGVGGLIGVGQLISSGLVGRLDRLNGQSLHAAGGDLSRWAAGHMSTMIAPGGGAAIWLFLAAAGLGTAWALTHWLEDI